MIISIDLETTGLDPETCQILEIGAVTSEGREFHCYVDNGLIQGEPYALQMNQAILKKIANNHLDLVSVKHVVSYFKGWLPEQWTATGKNFASFDLPFLLRLPGWDIKVKHRIVDPGNLYWKPVFDGHCLPDLKTCMERAGIGGDVPHTALEDAKIVLELVKRYYDSQNTA